MTVESGIYIDNVVVERVQGLEDRGTEGGRALDRV
jgi:hypothetical protein